MIVLIFFFLILVIEDGTLYLFDFSIFFFYPEFLPLVVNCSYNTNIDTNSLNSIKSML